MLIRPKSPMCLFTQMSKNVLHWYLCFGVGLTKLSPWHMPLLRAALLSRECDSEAHFHLSVTATASERPCPQTPNLTTGEPLLHIFTRSEWRDPGMMKTPLGEGTHLPKVQRGNSCIYRVCSSCSVKPQSSSNTPG